MKAAFGFWITGFKELKLETIYLFIYLQFIQAIFFFFEGIQANL